MQWQRVQTAVAVTLIAAGVVFYAWPRQPSPIPPPAARVMPDVGEPLALAVCSVNSARRAILHNARLFSNIVNTLSPRTAMLVLTNERDAFVVASDPWPQRVRFIDLPFETDITIWPQDPFVVLNELDGRTHLLVSREFDRAGDRAMAGAIARELNWPCQDSQLWFEGGNLLADEQRAFIGVNTIAYNAAKLKLEPEEVVRRFEAELGRPVLVIGPAPQPIGHIDMALTPLGGGRLALADPGWGAHLAEEQLNRNSKSVAAIEQAWQDGFFGDAGIYEFGNVNGEITLPPQLLGQTRRAIADSKAIAGHLDRLADELRSRGLEVARMPYLAVTETSTPQSRPATVFAPAASKPTTKPAQDRAHYPQLTYNNVLLETEGTQRVAYLPRYGWPTLDDAGARVWKDLGFKVRPVEGLTGSAMYGGSLRCCVKVLARANRTSSRASP